MAWWWMSYFTGGGECLGQYECPTLHMGWKMFRVMSIRGGECRCDERRTILWDIKFFYISVFWSIHIQYQIIGLIRIELKENYTTLLLPSRWKHFHKVVPQTCGKFSNSAFTGWYLHPSVWCPLQTSAQSLVHFIFLEESWFLQLYQVSSLIKSFHFIRRAAPSPENLKFSSRFLQRLPPLSLLSSFLLPKFWSCANRAFDPPILT